jgi:hypothetical protein
LADTWDGATDPIVMSLRDAIHLANQTIAVDEIWLPAWDFVLTRDRGTASTDMVAEYGDLDITRSLVIRGIGSGTTAFTTVRWRPGVLDRVFELVGDYNGDWVTDGVNAADWTVWLNTQGSTASPTATTADGNDDGEVDAADEEVWDDHYGNTLSMTFVTVI